MMSGVTFRRLAVIVAVATLSACATGGAQSGAGWAAHGYLTPASNGDPEIIGAYDSEAACRAALEGWMSRQVVGNPVSGDCLPIDSH